MIHSSFTYKNIFQGHDVMVFIPHEDDEINVAGATIYGLKQEGFHVICVFATNGNRSYLAETRIQEAAAALKTLGVPYEDIIILGYPDGGLDAARSPCAHGLVHYGLSYTYRKDSRPASHFVLELKKQAAPVSVSCGSWPRIGTYGA